MTATKPEVHQCGLTDTQNRLLLEAIKAERVSQRDGMSYVEAWDVRRHLNRIFGFMGWSEECLKNERIDIDKHPKAEKYGAKKGQPIAGTVCYTVTCEYTVRVHFKCSCGRVLTSHDGTAAGDGINLPTLAAAEDFAVKTAASQAVKRACINLGDTFGLSLYNNGSTSAVVIGTAFTMDANAMAKAETKVIGGEMDDQPDEDIQPTPDDPETAARVAQYDEEITPSPGVLRAQIAQKGRRLGLTLDDIGVKFAADNDGLSITAASTEQLVSFRDDLPEADE